MNDEKTFISLPQEEVGAAVSGLKHAATQFSHVFQQGACRVVHIHGEDILFSCFDLGDRHLLAFYSEKLTQSVLDTQEADRGAEEVSFNLFNSVVVSPQSYDNP